MSLSGVQQEIDQAATVRRHGALRYGIETGAHYSRREVRLLVAAYPSLTVTRLFRDSDEGGGQRLRQWSLEQQVVAAADLALAFEALRRWELTWPAEGYGRSVGMVMWLMHGRPLRQVALLLGCRWSDMPRLIEEGLEFVYLWLDGRTPEAGRISLPKHDAFGLADLWALVARDTTA